MDIKIIDGIVTIEVNRNELALLDCALGSFQTLAACPRPEYPGDRAAQEDVELANTMEQALFAAWCKLDEKVSYSGE
jgi:hypothetical protein